MQSLPERSPFLLSLLVYKLSPAVLVIIAMTAVVRGADHYPELPRFHQVSERLYRGAQPRTGGICRLAELGVNTIVNLRGAGSDTRTEEAEARALGLNYFNIPLPTWGRPDDATVRRIMEIITAPESGRVFVHCKDGVDRTGMIVALYRISSEGWSTNGATAEAVRYGMRRHQYWMRDYIGDYYVRQQRAMAHQQGQQTDENADGLKDKIGSGVRIGERAAFVASKTVVGVVRRAPRAVNEFLSRVF